MFEKIKRKGRALRNIVGKGAKRLRNFVFQKQIMKSTISDLEKSNTELQTRLDWFVEHADITTLKPATGYLRKKQLALIKFADTFFSDISELNIHPFLIAGNLIGAYRHNGFVPWDDDLDFGLIRSEYNRLIDYCKEHYIVTVYDGKWSEYNNDKHLERMDNLVSNHPNEYILDIWVDQLQIMKGTSCIDRLAIDFWSFDYYEDEYGIEEHVKYLNRIQQKKKEIDYVDRIVKYLENEINRNRNISLEPTKKVFPGIDNVEGYLRVNRTEKWLNSDDLFPLRYARYDNSQYYVPNSIENWLNYEYPDYMCFPSDAGKTPHEGYKEKYIRNNLPVVEFYLIDAFEIYHFIPLYYYFERHGIYSVFVAEKTSGKNAWFDYDEAIRILERNGVRYNTEPDYYSDFVITTQDANKVIKYKKRKIHMCYGMSLTSYSFCESSRTIDGFNLKLLHGNISYDVVKKKNPTLDLIKVGYLKYSRWGKGEYLYDIEERKKAIAEKNYSGKPVLLYFPTWDEGSSIKKYIDGFMRLKKDYFIITKAHHCTYRLESEEEHRRIINDISDIVLEGNYSFEEAVKLGDFALCDAISGAATEVPFLNDKIKLILLMSPLDSKNHFKSIIDKYSICVNNSDELVNAVNSIADKDPFVEERNNIIKEMYFTDEEQGLKRLNTYVRKYSKKGRKYEDHKQ